MKAHRETWERISSRANPVLKSLRSALRRGRPDAAGFCAVEGVHAVREALAAGLDVSAVVASDAAEAFIEDWDSRIPSRARRYVVSRRLFDTIADTETPQGVAAMVRLPSWNEDDLFTGRAPMVLVLDGVQDPGNLGAILRSAEAFRATGVFLTCSTVRRTNAKVLRAAAGSLFRLPIVEGTDAQQAVVVARQRGLRIFAAVPREGRPPAMVDFRGGVALAIGAEGPGLSPEVAALADERVTVPMASPVESLNAAVAASLLLYEAARQRSSRLDTIGAST